MPQPTIFARIIAGDLPCLTPACIDLVLALAQDHRQSFVSDAQGIGTTMLMDRAAVTSSPAFGERSRARHAQLGYVDLGLDSDVGDAVAGVEGELAQARREQR